MSISGILTRSLLVRTLVPLSLIALAFPAYAQQSELPQRALIVLTSTNTMIGSNTVTGYDLPEAVLPYYLLRDAGFHVDFASSRGGAPAVAPRSIDTSDALLRRFMTDSSLQGLLHRTIPSSAVVPDRYGIILFAGGYGALWDFLADTLLHQAAARVYGRRGILATIGQGAAVLLNTMLSDGQYIYKDSRVTCTTDEETELDGVQFTLPYLLETALRRGGAIHFRDRPFVPNIIAENRLITGQNAESTRGVVTAIIETWKRLQDGTQ